MIIIFIQWIYVFNIYLSTLNNSKKYFFKYERKLKEIELTPDLRRYSMLRDMPLIARQSSKGPAVCTKCMNTNNTHT